MKRAGEKEIGTDCLLSVPTNSHVTCATEILSVRLEIRLLISDNLESFWRQDFLGNPGEAGLLDKSADKITIISSLLRKSL